MTKTLNKLVTIKDAKDSISSALEKHDAEIEKYPFIGDYKDFIRRIEDAGYIISQHNGRNSIFYNKTGTRVAEISPEGRIKILLYNSRNIRSFKDILSEYLDYITEDKKPNEISYSEIKKQIDNLVAQNYNGDDSPNTPWKDWENEAYKLIMHFIMIKDIKIQ